MAAHQEGAQHLDEDAFFDYVIDPRLVTHLTEECGKTTQAQSSFTGSIEDSTSADTCSFPSSPSASTPAHDAFPDARIHPRDGFDGIDGDNIRDEDVVLPKNMYQSLDVLLHFNKTMPDRERCWLEGLQQGIGLGIRGAREAVLNEMQNEGTVFGRRLQSDPDDPLTMQVRMQLGEACQGGFDLRVAHRVAHHFIANCNLLANSIIANGSIHELPNTGKNPPGTHGFFNTDNINLCYQNHLQKTETYSDLGHDTAWGFGGTSTQHMVEDTERMSYPASVHGKLAGHTGRSGYNPKIRARKFVKGVDEDVDEGEQMSTAHPAHEFIA